MAAMAVLALTLAFGAAGPAQADPPSPQTLAEDAPQASSYPARSTLLVAPAAQRLETARKTRPVAPGITLTSFDSYDSAGWLRADAISADLTGGASAGYLYSGEVSKDEPLSGPAGRARAVAAVNGDFFDINNSGAAQGVGIHDGDLVQSPIAGHDNAVAITADGVGRVLRMHFDGTATPEGGAPVTLTQFNQLVQGNGVGLFTPSGAPTAGPARSRARPRSPRSSSGTAPSPRCAPPPGAARSRRARRSCSAGTPERPRSPR